MKTTMYVGALSLVIAMFPVHATVPTVPSSPSSVVNSPKEKIHLNKADVATLTQSIKGIGKKRAQAIVSYREAHGAFKSIAELAEVRGLGQAFVSKHLSQLENVYSID